MKRGKGLLLFCNLRRLAAPLAYSFLTLAATVAAPSASAQVLRCTDPRTGGVTYTDGKCPDRTVLQEVQPRITEQEAAEQRARTAAALQEKQQRLAAQALEAQKQADAAKAAQAASARPDTGSAATYAASAECAKAKAQLQAMERDASSRATQAFIEASAAAQRQVELACLGPDRFAELEIARATQPRIVTPPAAVVQPWPYVQPGYGYGSPYGYGYRPQAPMAPVFPSVGTPTPPRHLVQCTDYHCTDNQGQKYPKYGKGRFPGNGGVCKSVGGQAPC